MPMTAAMAMMTPVMPPAAVMMMVVVLLVLDVELDMAVEDAEVEAQEQAD